MIEQRASAPGARVARAQAAQNCRLVKAIQPAPNTDLVEVLRTAGAGRAFTAAAPLFAATFTCTLVRQHEHVVYRGLEGFWTAWNDWLRGWSSYVTGRNELLAAGNRVVVLTKARAVMRVDDKRHGARQLPAPQALETRGAAIWTIRGGTVASVAFYESRTEALEVAGVVE